MAPPEEQRQSLVDVLASYHRGVADDLAAVRADVDGDDDADVGPTIERLVIQMVGVLVAEEQYLFPVMRDTMSDGMAATDEQFSRHRQLEHELRRLEDLELTPDLIAPILADVEQHWSRLTAYLDTEVFPVVRDRIDAGRLAELGDDVLGAIEVAPTRPREFAPTSPAVSKVVSFAEGWIDRWRDSWSRRGRGEDDVDDTETQDRSDLQDR